MAACHPQAPGGPIVTSVVATGAATEAPALRGMAGRGLVRLDAEGQIVPDAAIRWAISDDGLDYIFRIEDGLSAHDVARELARALRSSADRPLSAILKRVESVEAVTSTVVELRLSGPMPDLIALLGRPELAFTTIGGPFIVRAGPNGTTTLTPQSRPGDATIPPVWLRVERVGRAVARFAAGRAALVTGGTFTDLAVADASTSSARALRRDPATGLFGLAQGRTGGPLDDPTLRQALSLAIDRDRIVTLIGIAGWTKATTVAGSTVELPLDQRLAQAHALRAGRSTPATPLRVAMPDGPGARLLFRLLARDWARIGITIERVSMGEPADLVLVDRVAPSGELAALACAASAGCDIGDPLALLTPPFLPIAMPLRWSLVSDRLGGFTTNPTAVHPLDRLVAR